jgi:biopolymer transport protein ExbD
MAHAPRSSINVTPLIDIVLVLLIAFIVMVPVALHHQPAGLPARGDARLIKRGPLRLTLLPGGAMQLNQEVLGPEALLERLCEAFAAGEGTSQTVVLDVDGGLGFQHTVRALDLVRAASDRVKQPGADDARVAILAPEAPAAAYGL